MAVEVTRFDNHLMDVVQWEFDVKFAYVSSDHYTSHIGSPLSTVYSPPLTQLYSKKCAVVIGKTVMDFTNQHAVLEMVKDKALSMLLADAPEELHPTLKLYVPEALGLPKLVSHVDVEHVEYPGEYFVGHYGYTTESNTLARESQLLPGMYQTVTLPCTCAERHARDSAGMRQNIRSAIMHLNDKCGWSREQIADWLDELHDAGEINIEFEVSIDD